MICKWCLVIGAVLGSLATSAIWALALAILG